MALQLRRGTQANLPAPSDALVGEPLFTTDTGRLYIKKSDGTLVQIGSGGSGPGSVAWGEILGSIASQADLQAALAAKAAATHTHSLSQIEQGGATTGQVIKWSGTTWAPAADDSSAAGAPTNADYLVRTANGSLSAERVVGDSTSVAANWNTSGAVTFERAALTGDVTASANSNATTIAAGAVTATKLADAAVTGAKIAASAVGSTQIAASAVTTDKLASSVYAGSGSLSTVARSDHGHSLSALSGTILLGAAGTAQLPTPADTTQTATIQWVPGTGWSIVQSTQPPPQTYDPTVDYLPQAYGATWPPSSGAYVEGVEVGDTYTGTVTLSPTTGTTGITFAIDGTPTGSLTVTASQAAPAVSAPSAFSLATTASRRRTVAVTATNGSTNKVDTTTLDFGWRCGFFFSPTLFTQSTSAADVQAAMQAYQSGQRIEFQPDATSNGAPVNWYTYTTAGGSIVYIYFASTVSGSSDAYGWTPTFVDPGFQTSSMTLTLVGTFNGIVAATGAAAKSYRVWRFAAAWPSGITVTTGVR